MGLSTRRDSGHTPSLIAALLHFDVSFMVWVLLGALGATIGAAGGLGGFLLPFGFGTLEGSTGTFAFGFLAVAAIAAGGAIVVTRRTSIAAPRPALTAAAVPA